MKNSVLGKFLSSGVQALAVQILGIFFFYFISFYCSKESFGVISWANAVSMFLTTILSFGMEQVVTRRIAVSKTSDWAAAAYLFHSFIGSIIALSVLFIIHLFVRESIVYYYLPFFFIAQGIIYISASLRQYLNAKEKFVPYAVIAVISNVGKILSVIYTVRNGTLSLDNIVIIMIGFSAFEFLSLLIYILNKSSFNFSLQFKFSAYKKLLKEAMPQYVAVIFDSGLSRLDWILLGFISTNVITADYSFAYRAFEIAKLPVVIIAPIILTRLSRLLHQNGRFDEQKQKLIKNIYLIELFIAISVALPMNILWKPVVGAITHGKYGASNQLQFLLLSITLPIQFFTNLLWTICFAGRKYKTVSIITITSAVCNLILNLILIPLYGGIGAAIAFLVTCSIQCGIYYLRVKADFLAFPLGQLLAFYVFAFASYFISTMIATNFAIQIVLSGALYILMCFMFRLLKIGQLRSVKAILIE